MQKADGYMGLALRKATSDTNIGAGVTLKDEIKGVKEILDSEREGERK